MQVHQEQREEAAGGNVSQHREWQHRDHPGPEELWLAIIFVLTVTIMTIIISISTSNAGGWMITQLLGLSLLSSPTTPSTSPLSRHSLKMSCLHPLPYGLSDPAPVSDCVNECHSPGVPWTLHSWIRTLLTAQQGGLSNILDELLQVDISMSLPLKQPPTPPGLLKGVDRRQLHLLHR